MRVARVGDYRPILKREDGLSYNLRGMHLRIVSSPQEEPQIRARSFRGNDRIQRDAVRGPPDASLVNYM
jgi:hypothetical protein